MANGIKQGDRVYVPRSKIGLGNDSYSSFYLTTVIEKERDKIKVDLPGGTVSEWVSVSFAKKSKPW